MSIEVKNLTYVIKDKTILKNISLTVKSGKILTIIGPNGSGKSSFIKLLAGDKKPTSGSIFYNGFNIEELSLEKKALTRAVMSQSHTINFDYSVKEIIEMGWIERGVKTIKSDFRETIQNISKKCFIIDLLDRKINTLSGGEQKRVHLARTLMQIWSPDYKFQNKYLILDEPLNNLDLFHEINTMKIIKDMADRNIGIALILHDLNLAAKYSDYIAVFYKGKLMFYGSPKKVLNAENLYKVFDLRMKVNYDPLHINYVQ